MKLFSFGIFVIVALTFVSSKHWNVTDGVASAVIGQFSNNSVLDKSQFLNLRNTIRSTPKSVGSLSEDIKRTQCAPDDKKCISLYSCIEDDHLWSLARSNDDRVDLEQFKAVCPLLLLQSDRNVCKDSETTHVVRLTRTGIPSAKVWGYGILFVTLISLCSLVGVSVMPLMGKAFYSKLLTVLVGLAVGSLFGSSVFHLIPQAFGIMDPEVDPTHEYLNISLLIFGGFWLFFMIERMLKIIMESKDRNAHRSPEKKEEKELDTLHHLTPRSEGCVPIAVGDIYESQEQVIKASFGHMEKPKKQHHGHAHIQKSDGKSPIATVAWMIVFGDGLHNFIDGLSIGAAFSESINTGISISVAVMCEELPHELGDFAVLLASGMTMKQALLYNFLSACTCYAGLAVGIMLGEIEASKYIFALAGGMFLYISLTDMVPEMNEIAEEASKESVWSALRILLLQNIGMFIGVFALYVLAKYQDLIQIGA